LFGAPSGLAGALLSGGMRQAPTAQVPPAPGQAQATRPALKALPAIRLDGGRVRFGPISIPGIRLPPLY
jgi:hypothetical protein